MVGLTLHSSYLLAIVFTKIKLSDIRNLGFHYFRIFNQVFVTVYRTGKI